MKKIMDYVATEEGKEQALELIEEVMDYFEFDKVHKVMKFLDWQWLDKGVPDIPEIRKEARRQMKECLFDRNDTDYIVIASGGLKATCFVLDVDDVPDDVKHRIALTLEFILEEFSITI